MDKQTLSNYGWIVVCILVLSVMLALATPLGRFIAKGFEATYTGFSHVTDKAFGVIGIGGSDEGGSDGTGTAHDGHFIIYEDNKDGKTHLVHCKDCDELIAKEEEHIDKEKEDKICDLCGADLGGASAPSFGTTDLGEHKDHVIMYEDNKDGSHFVHCKDCDVIISKNDTHVDTEKEDKICDMCGADMSGASAPSCEHTSVRYEDMQDGTHLGICDGCGAWVSNDEHIDKDTDGICDVCKATATCQHNNVTFTDNGDDTHDGVCDNCSQVTINDQAHYDYNSDYKCDRCGAELPWSIATELQNNQDGFVTAGLWTMPYGNTGVATLKAETVFNVIFDKANATWYWEDLDGNTYEGSPSDEAYENGTIKYIYKLYDATEFEALAREYFGTDLTAQLRTLTAVGLNRETYDEVPYSVYDGSSYKYISNSAGGYATEWVSYTDNGNDNYDVYVNEIETGKWFKINLDWNGTHFVYNSFTLVDSNEGANGIY